ncbi:MAG: hypothetical protein ACOC7U_04335 [Spirochaetota bacterium]
MGFHHIGKRLYRADCPVAEGSLGRVVAGFGAEVVVGHPTFKNENTIGNELYRGVKAAAEVYKGKNVAFVVSDGSYRMDMPEDSTLKAALEGAEKALSELDRASSEHIMVIAAAYDGYKGDRTPGKGSALKILYDELGYCPTLRELILLDGDLRNELKPWFKVFSQVEASHRQTRKGKDFFITARYARHFVDASLTRFVVGPLTTLMGEYVPGGISGDIVLSAGAVQHERNAEWDKNRRRYGTDIATTFDNIADPHIAIYEVYLGAKLHEITDEAKLSVMPGEVIGAALERLLYYQRLDGRVEKLLGQDVPLAQPHTWGPEKTGIGFIDPGYTEVFDVDFKRMILVDKFYLYRDAIKKVLVPETFGQIKKALSRLQQTRADDRDQFIFLGVSSGMWIEILYQAMGYLLSKKDPETVKLCLNYLYTAAFLEFCREKIISLGGDTFGKVRSMQSCLGAPPHKASQFYEREVDGAAKKMALEFYNDRRKILSYM